MAERGQAAAAPAREKTEFAKRNPNLEKWVPDSIENFVDALLPDAFEAKLDKGAKHVADRWANFKTDFNEGFGEVAGVLFRVCKYAATRFNIGDIVFGIYHLADYHNRTDAIDDVKGKVVSDPDLVKHLVYCTDMAVMSYCPNKDELCKAAGISPEDVVAFKPEASTNRPAYAVVLDHANKNVIWGFRGTTDLNDMLTDACASCTPYLDGYAHWGMLEAAEWFVKNEVKNVREVCARHPSYKLLLVGHSLGAGTATLLAHWIKNKPETAELFKDVKVEAVGIATPAVLTAEMAEGCSDYVTSVVHTHDLVPRFSIHNVFKMKNEMDATKWGDLVSATVKDWMVPDVIEHSQTYKRLSGKITNKADDLFKRTVSCAVNLWLNATAAVVSGLHFLGIVKPNKKLAESQEVAAAGTFADKARAMANATTKTAKAALNDPAVVQAAAASVRRELEQVAEEDVHEVFAPGRLYFLRRYDPPKPDSPQSTATASSDDGATSGSASGSESSVAEASATASASASADGLALASDGKGKGKSKGKKAKKEKPRDPYPGATFELIEGAPEERFRRICLRESCLMDHLCGGYIQGLEFALKTLDPTAVAPAPAPAAAE